MVAIEKYKEVKSTLDKKNVKLIAVSKTKPISAIKILYDLGQRAFGENYVQELLEKKEELANDTEWHCIGHLQTKKVKQIASFVSLIHSVDSLKLLKEIDKRAMQENRVISCLLQMHIAEEDSKTGMEQTELQSILDCLSEGTLNNVTIAGLMGITTFTSQKQQVIKEFRSLRSLFDRLKTNQFASQANFKECSMGMSGDYELAIEEGSTMVRIGSLLFGQR